MSIVVPLDSVVSPPTFVVKAASPTRKVVAVANPTFVNFGADYKLLDEYGDVVDRMSFLKFTNTGLRINIAIGG
ncbi:hypothetical protein N7489_005842 [Penicillium chrysogenum]|uniref:uncharacterized protein n=1 Tax=Penicillium chrysogenum TaxID=5076 RepID=UPI0024DF2B40|nr:uncharacterized protein N7489_005842 [Penicillium chrysogenum]KAJ5245746.1 hypothetical protein N7489_005842 [Penicillium chrysogenum]KAJ6136701.1 hypothetical protein N7497_012405 [Penicillium chrysogenum]